MNDDLRRAIDDDRKRLEGMTLADLDWEHVKQFKRKGISHLREYMVEQLLAARWKDALAREAEHSL